MPSSKRHRFAYSLIILYAISILGCGSPEFVDQGELPPEGGTDNAAEQVEVVVPEAVQAGLPSPTLHSGQATMNSDAHQLTGRIWSAPVRSQSNTYILRGGF